MKCLNCGSNNNYYLCDKCRTNEVLDKIFNEIAYFRQETCENSYLLEYTMNYTEKYAVREIILEVLKLFDCETVEYYFCRYYRLQKDERFEESALDYIDTHKMNELHTQTILYDLIENYLPNNFIKPKKWCEIIVESNDFACELYAVAAKYFAMIGEYDLSDAMLNRGIDILKDTEHRKLRITLSVS